MRVVFGYRLRLVFAFLILSFLFSEIYGVECKKEVNKIARD